MNRVSFFIDGFNLYHALEGSEKETMYRKYKWLNLRKLSELFIKKNEKITRIFYFTAYASWNAEKEKKHRLYVKALQKQGVSPVFGKFKKKYKKCNKYTTIQGKKCEQCKGVFPTAEEKQTDVNIAIQLLSDAYKNRFDTAILVSGDTDIIPAIKRVKEDFPQKQIKVILPIGRKSEELKLVVDSYSRMKEKHLKSSLLEDEVLINSNFSINNPFKKEKVGSNT